MTTNIRTALVGGASRGLGLGCAKALAERGIRVVMCAREKTALETVADDVRGIGTEVLVFACDWSHKQGLESLDTFLKDNNISIDVLVNNVGGPSPGLVTETSEEGWERGLDLLFRSTVRLYSMVLPGMRERKWGRVVNILSTTAVEPSTTLAVSSVIRAGLASYAKLTAWEVAKDGVTVNSVMPSGFLTTRTEELMADTAKREGVAVSVVRERLESTLPLGRFMEPIELGRAVAFLASDEAAGINGALLPVDGGTLRSL